MTDTQYGPEAFFGDDSPAADPDTNATLPKSEGGLIEAVKRAVVTALRDALVATDLRVDGGSVYVDLEYPQEQTQYPGVWVQFSPTQLQRQGMNHEVLLDEGEERWGLVQEWQFTGRITLSIAALTSKDRDRLSDLIIANLAFARPPDLVITKPHEDTKKYKSLIAALDENPYIAMTLNTDQIYPGGQSVEVGTPWQPDVLAYTDSYSFDLIGQFNVAFHDGVYTLHRIDLEPYLVDAVPEQLSRRTNWWGPGPVEQDSSRWRSL